MIKRNSKKVLVCLSGGVDSAVSAAILVKSDKYDVTGVYMRQWSENEDFSGVCPWKEDRREAMRVAAFLGISFLTFDFEQEYKKWVVDYLFREYQKGRTPNPDILCNKFIKFGFWIKKAKDLGFDYLATGHYAQISKKGKEFLLEAAKDENKDQTYFLHQLNQSQLTKTLFPIGQFTKVEVRKMAHKFKLPNADRSESMGICFIGEIPIQDFLSTKIKAKKGKIVLEDGSVVGEHKGLHLYTIGQRHLGVDTKKIGDKSNPLYVAYKNHKTNELVLASQNSDLLNKKDIEVLDVSWVSGQEPKFPLNCEVRLRHRQKLQKCEVEKISKNKLKVKFSKKEWAPAPGQFAVFYKNINGKKVCLGGGEIE